MRLILLGAPGVGKGTQANRLTKKFGTPHISTGDILRKEIQDETPLGIQARDILAEGKLVTDDLILELVEDRLKQPDAQAGFLLDGFPRTTPQAVGFDGLLDRLDAALDAIIALGVETRVLLRRLAARRICPNCGAVYNLVVNPPKEMDTCDRCGHHGLVRRDDDDPETIKERLAIYQQHTLPLLSYYRPGGRLLEIDGDGSEETVYNAILAALPDQR